MCEKLGTHLRLHIGSYHMSLILNEITKVQPYHIKCKNCNTGYNYCIVLLVWYVVVEHTVRHNRVNHTQQRYKY